MDDRIEDLGDLLAEGGAVVGGGTAIGYALGWVVGSVLRDVGARGVWARKGGQLGGIAGLVALTLRLFGVR